MSWDESEKYLRERLAAGQLGAYWVEALEELDRLRGIIREYEEFEKRVEKELKY